LDELFSIEDLPNNEGLVEQGDLDHGVDTRPEWHLRGPKALLVN
jgi:hypothetical protein